MQRRESSTITYPNHNDPCLVFVQSNPVFFAKPDVELPDHLSLITYGGYSRSFVNMSRQKSIVGFSLDIAIFPIVALFNIVTARIYCIVRRQRPQSQLRCTADLITANSISLDQSKYMCLFHTKKAPLMILFDCSLVEPKLDGQASRLTPSCQVQAQSLSPFPPLCSVSFWRIPAT